MKLYNRIVVKNIDGVHTMAIKTVLLDMDGTLLNMGESAFEKGYYDKQILKFINRGYVIVPERIFYENNIVPGLDEYGNISLDTKLEVPVLRGGFKYYPNKENNDKTESIVIDAIQVFFI